MPPKLRERGPFPARYPVPYDAKDPSRAHSDVYKRQPKTIVKEISGMGVLEISSKDDSADKPAKRVSRAEIEQKINQLTREMREAAKILEFEHAAFPVSYKHLDVYKRQAAHRGPSADGA